jgi:hypothetical protein
LIYIIEKDNISGVFRIIAAVLSAIFLDFFMYLTVRKLQKQMLSSETDLGGKIANQSLMTHHRGLLSDGGVGYLLQDKLVFVPHKFNIFPKNINILFTDIDSIAKYHFFHFIDLGVKIKLKSGKIEKFVISGKDRLYKELLQLSYK